MSKTKFRFIPFTYTDESDLILALSNGTQLYGIIDHPIAHKLKCKLVDIHLSVDVIPYNSSKCLTMHFQESLGSRLIVRHKANEIKWYIKTLVD